MTWKSHRIITFATILAITANVYAAGFSMLGSTFPDRVEGPLRKIIHRTYSHWFVIYIIALATLFLYNPQVLNPMQINQTMTVYPIHTFLFWFTTGSLLHIIEDAVCGKIPTWSPTKRKNILPRLFYTGSFKEYLYSLSFSAIMLLTGIYRIIQ